MFKTENITKPTNNKRPREYDSLPPRPIEMFSTDNYLPEHQGTEFKGTILNFTKKKKNQGAYRRHKQNLQQPKEAGNTP